MSQPGVTQKIIDFLVDKQGIQKDLCAPDNKILSDGTVDSYGLLELTIFIEEEFNITVDEEGIAKSETIADAAKLISSKIAGVD